MGFKQDQNRFLCYQQDLGLIDFEKAYALQKEKVERAIHEGQQWLLICEHPAVLTLGRMAQRGNILAQEQSLRAQGIAVIPVDRGGDVTLHCPGQMVIYPILHLKVFGQDLNGYLRKLEQVAIDFLNEFDIVADRIPGRTGVWVGQKKIASIGIGVKRWVTYHGMAININTPLDLFSLIRPCGMDVTMTSLKALKGRSMEETRTKAVLWDVFRKNFPVDFKAASG